MSRQRSSAAVIGILTLAAMTPATSALELKPKFEPDQVTHYYTTSNTRLVTSSAQMPQPQEIMLRGESGWRIKVLKVNDDGSAELEFTLLMFALNLGDLMTADSRTDESGPATRIFAGIIDQPFTAVVNPDGSIRDISGTEEMLKGIGSGQNPIQELTKSALKKGNLESLIGSKPLVGASPDVKEGDSWDFQDITPEDNFVLVIKGKCKFSGTKEKKDLTLASVKFSADVSSEELDAPEDAKDDKAMSIELDKGSSKGEIQWDVKQGQLYKLTSKLVLNMDISGGQLPPGMTLNRNTSTKYKIIRVDTPKKFMKGKKKVQTGNDKNK